MNGVLRALALVAAIGAINWGLIGFFNFNLVDAIFGGGSREVTSGLSRFIYALVGLCGLGLAALLPRIADLRAPKVTEAVSSTGERRRMPRNEPPRPHA